MTGVRQDIGFREFVTLMASLISMVALSIDVMLPALRQMGEELNAANPNDPQLIIGLFFRLIDLVCDPFAGNSAPQCAQAVSGRAGHARDLGSAAQSIGVWMHGDNGIGVCIVLGIPEFSATGARRSV